MNFGVARFRRLLPVSCASLAVVNVCDLLDSVIAGRILGESALGAIELAWPVIELIYFLGVTVANGTAIRFVTAAGAFRKGDADEAFSNGLVLSALTGLAGVALMVFLRGPFFSFVGVGADTVQYVRPYWNCLLAYPVAAMLNQFLMALVCADGDTRLGTSAFIAEFLANVGTTWFACRSLGAVGCALGPLCGQLASLAVLLPHFLSDRNSLRFRPYFSLRDSGRVFLTEFPASAAVLFTSLVYVFMNRTLVAQDGDSALVVLAAVSVSNNLMLFLFGVPNAAQPIIGVFRGEGNVRGISTVMCDAVRVSALLGGALSAVLSLWPDFPARIIGIDDPDILVRATEAVRIMAPSYLFFGIGTLFFTYYLFVERRMAAMTLTTLQEFAFPLAGCLCGRALGGAVGFWCGYALAPVLALSVFFGVLRLRRRGAFDPFMLPPADDRVFEWNVFVSEKTACEVASAVHGRLDQSGVPMKTAVRADMLVEDMLMTVRERNAGRKVRAAVMLDQRSGVRLVFHDDGVAASSFVDSGDRGWFRAQTLGAVIGTAAGRNSAVTCGFNRNEYSFDCR